MSDDHAALFEAVRAACKPAVWSRGVELVRAGAVIAGQSEHGDELRFQITRRGGMISRGVSLFPDDREWDCGCDWADEVCEHVAAAVIALQRSEEGGEGVRSAEEAGRLAYRFGRESRRLTLERWIITPSKEVLLTATLAAVAEGRVDGPRFAASQLDLAIELVLGTHRRGPLPPPVLGKLFRHLARVAELTLDGEPVRVQVEPLSAVLVVEDDGPDFVVRLAPGDPVDERFENGVVRCGEALRLPVEPKLNARERSDFERGLRVPAGRAAELVTDRIPDWSRRIPVRVRTERLPDTERLRPEVRFEIQRDGETLHVLPTLCYGDPPRARVDAGRLVHLQGKVPLRDESAERALTRQLRERLTMSPGVRESADGAAAVELSARLQRWQSPVRSPALQHFALQAPVEPHVAIEGAALDVRFVGAARQGGSPPQADPTAVLRAWRAGESLVPLLGGGYAPLPMEWLAAHGARIADLIQARGQAPALPPSAWPELAELAAALEQPVAPEVATLRDALSGLADLPPASLPPDLDVELRPYQRVGIDWLCRRGELGVGALLADDMGLGKTLQALASIRGRCLVVAPTSVLHNWEREAERFRPQLKVNRYHGPRRQIDPEAGLTATSYALLRLDREALSQVEWDTVVLDEAQAIKNPESRVAQAAFSLQARRRIALTGTPVENRLEELWSQFHFLNPGMLGGRSDFRERYADPIGSGDEDAVTRLRARVRPFVLRRLKQEVARDLPPRTDVVRRCELAESEWEVYRTIQAATREDVLAKLQQGGSVLAALEALLRLRQAACHSGLVPGYDAESSSKVDLLMETLDAVAAEGHRALVFSQWTGLLDRVEPHLQDGEIEFLRLDGSTRDRGAVVDRFQAADGPPVLLISLKAGGAGLNLTAADHVFLLDPWWNPAVEDQAADRAHRIGQERPVIVHRLVAAETVEERILALQDQKRRLAEAALGQGGAAALQLSRDELLDLLR